MTVLYLSIYTRCRVYMLLKCGICSQYTVVPSADDCRRAALLVDADLGSEKSYDIIIPQFIELFVSTVVLISV